MEIFEKAIQYATEKHKNQKRKDGSIYILHPMEVATIAATLTEDEEILSAALLHDVVEDANTDIEEIKEEFGERIGKIIALETEPTYPNLSKKESWLLRKQETLKRLNDSKDIGYKIVFLSDKLSNIRSLFRDIEKNQEDAFLKFNIKDKEIQAWYYYEILEQLKELKNEDAYKELEEKIQMIFQKRIRRDEDAKKNYHL